MLVVAPGPRQDQVGHHHVGGDQGQQGPQRAPHRRPPKSAGPSRSLIARARAAGLRRASPRCASADSSVGLLATAFEPILEDRAVALRRPAEAARRDAGGAVEGAHEVGEVAEADVERDVGDRARRRRPSRRAAWRSRERTRYWCGVTPSTLAKSRRKWNGAEPGLAGRALEIDRLVRVRVDPERRLHRAAAIARAGAGGGCASRPETTSTKRAANNMPTSSRPTSLRPRRPPARARRAPSARAAAARRRCARPRARSPIVSTSSGASWNDRHSSPRTWSCVQTYSSPGWPTRIEPATSSNDSPRHAIAEAALAHVGDRVKPPCSSTNGSSPGPRCTGSRSPRSTALRSSGRGRHAAATVACRRGRATRYARSPAFAGARLPASPARPRATGTSSPPCGTGFQRAPRFSSSFARRQLALPEGDREALADAVVVRRQHVRAAEAEDQQHLHGPAADAAHRGEALDDRLVRPCGAARRASGSRRPCARRARSRSDEQLRAREAGAAQLLVGGAQDLLGRRAVVRAREERAHAREDRRRGLAGELLVDDRLGERDEDARRLLELERERADARR